MLFTISKARTILSAVNSTKFDREKELQTLIEGNLEQVFGCRFIATEFLTGKRHAGRIDTLALSEENNPAIIEYKKKATPSLINQSLYYLDWINDHRGDFEIAAQKALGNQVKVDWSDILVICLAPDYGKYDLHAVRAMDANLQLWTYKLFANDLLYLEKVKSTAIYSTDDPRELSAGQKAALSRKTGAYTVEQHFENKPVSMQDIARSIQEFIVGLDSAIEEVPKKFYIAYKLSKNIVCMQIQKDKVQIYAKLDPKQVDDAPKQLHPRDMTGTGHYGTGDFGFSVKDPDDIELAKPLLEQAYQRAGE